MRLIILLVLSLPGFLANPLQWRIVGGSTAKEGQFPYQVTIRLNGNHFCGGSIIQRQWILTAAHCLYGMDASQMSVVVGTNTVDQGGDEYKVEITIPHGNWDSSKIINDIGLIKLKNDIEYNSKVSAIPLNDAPIAEGSELTLSGWGRLSYPGLAPKNLQYIKLKTIGLEECNKKHYPLSVYDTEICTYNSVGQGACKGDSGGPLVFHGKLAGVVSWGQPCAVGYPDVFTSVSAYLQWIHLNIENNP